MIRYIGEGENACHQHIKTQSTDTNAFERARDDRQVHLIKTDCVSQMLQIHFVCEDQQQ